MWYNATRNFDLEGVPMTAFELNYRTVSSRELDKLGELREAAGVPGDEKEDLRRLGDERGEYSFICLGDTEIGWMYLRDAEPVYRDVSFELRELCLVPVFWRQGIGRLVFAYVRELCRSWGRDALCCRVGAGNWEAAAFFRSVGGVPKDGDGECVWFLFDAEEQPS